MGKHKQSGICVEVRYPKNGSDADNSKAFHSALKVFKKMVLRDGILQDFKDRMAYEKPSDKKRREKAAARRRWQKDQARQLEERGF